MLYWRVGPLDTEPSVEYEHIRLYSQSRTPATFLSFPPTHLLLCSTPLLLHSSPISGVVSRPRRQSKRIPAKRQGRKRKTEETSVKSKKHSEKASSPFFHSRTRKWRIWCGVRSRCWGVFCIVRVYALYFVFCILYERICLSFLLFIFAILLMYIWSSILFSSTCNFLISLPTHTFPLFLSSSSFYLILTPLPPPPPSLAHSHILSLTHTSSSSHMIKHTYSHSHTPPHPLTWSNTLTHFHLFTQALCTNCEMEDLNIMNNALGGEPALKDSALFLPGGTVKRKNSSGVKCCVNYVITQTHYVIYMMLWRISEC